MPSVERSIVEQYAAAGYNVDSSETTEINGIKFFVFELSLMTNRATDNILQYFTIYDHMALSFAWHDYRDAIDSGDEAAMAEIIGSIVFGAPLEGTAVTAAAADSGSGKTGGSKLGTK